MLRSPSLPPGASGVGSTTTPRSEAQALLRFDSSFTLIALTERRIDPLESAPFAIQVRRLAAPVRGKFVAAGLVPRLKVAVQVTASGTTVTV